MAIGGNLLVTNTGAYKNFNVQFYRNTEITNYHNRNMNEVGDFHTSVKNGKDGTTIRNYSNGTSGVLGSLDLNSKRYAIFDKLRKLDGNENDVSEKDLLSAKELIGTEGVKNVKIDSGAGITTIYCDDGAVLKFDTETAAEKATREKQEANSAKAKQQVKEQEAAKKAQKEATFYENCKSSLEKAVDAIIDYFSN